MASELLDNDSQNFARLFMLTSDKGTEVFRKTLQLFSTTKCSVATFKEVLDFAEPFKRRVSPSFVQKLLWPAIDPPDRVEHLDITACNSLLYLKEVSDLTNGFNDPLKDALETIKEFRNQLCHHLTRKFSDPNFNKNFDDMKQAFQDIGIVNPSLFIPGIEIERYRTLPITKEGYTEVLSILKETLHVKQEVDKLKLDSTSTIQYMVGLQQDSVIQKQEVAVLKKDSSIQKQDVAELKKDTALQTQDVTLLKQDIGNIKLDSAKQRQDVVELKHGIVIQKKEIAVLKHDTATQKQDVDKLKQDTAAQKQDVDKLKQDTAAQKQDIVELKHTVFPPVENIPVDYCFKLVAALKTKYLEEMSFVQFNPVDSRARTPMKQMYVNLTLIELDKELKNGINNQISDIRHYCDIFKWGQTEHLERNLRIMIQGEAGIGKTTLSRKIAYDWASGHEDTLKQFENVFILSLRKIEPKQSLSEIIADQLLPYKDPYFTDYIEQYINENCDKCLFVFDGLDEMKQNTSNDIEKIIEGSYLGNLCLVITSRPSEAYDHCRSKKKIDLYAKIAGFSHGQREEFVLKFFVDMDMSGEGPTFYELICKKDLHIASIPIVLNILCMLYAEEKALPDSISGVYRQLREFLCRRQRDVNTKSVYNEGEIEMLWFNLGKVAFEGLLDNQIYFPASIIDEKALKIGIIAIDKDPHKMKKNTQCSFLHKTLQENLAAFYLAKEADKGNEKPWEKLKDKLKTITDFKKNDLVLQFCAGESTKLGLLISESLHSRYNPELKTLFESLQKLSQQDLLKEEILTVIQYIYQNCLKIKDDYFEHMEIVGVESNIITNSMQPLENCKHGISQLYEPTWFTEDEDLAPKKCLARVEKDEDLKKLIETTNSVSWVHLGVLFEKSFSVTETTVRLLKDLFDHNKYALGVSIDVNLGVPSKSHVLSLLALLKDHPKVKYVHIELKHLVVMWIHRCSYTNEQWEELFEAISGIPSLFGLDISDCDIPESVLQPFGKMLNLKSTTFLHLDLSGIEALFRHLAIFCQAITNPLALKVFTLNHCEIDSSGKAALRHLLQKSIGLEILNLEMCTSDVSTEIIQCKTLKELNVSHAKDAWDDLQDNMLISFVENRIPHGRRDIIMHTIGRFNVGKVLRNLDHFDMLEVLNVQNCGLGDGNIKIIPFNKPSKLRKLLLNKNDIGKKGLRHILKNADKLRELKEINLKRNSIGDDAGEIMMKGLLRFPQLEKVSFGENSFSHDMESKIIEKCSQCGIEDDSSDYYTYDYE